MINDLCKLAHDSAVSKGFYERERNLPELLMLVVSELAEAMEAERGGEVVSPGRQAMARVYASDYIWNENAVKGFYENMRGTIEEEIADACIRIFDLCGYYGIDLEAWIEAKMAYNATRPAKHGKKY